MPFGNTCHESRSCTWICSSAPGNYFTCLVFFTFSSWLTSLNHPMNVRIEKAPSFRRNFICWGRESKSHYEREGGNYPWNKTALISLIFDLGRPINPRDPFTININPQFPVPASGVSPIVCLKASDGYDAIHHRSPVSGLVAHVVIITVEEEDFWNWKVSIPLLSFIDSSSRKEKVEKNNNNLVAAFQKFPSVHFCLPQGLLNLSPLIYFL